MGDKNEKTDNVFFCAASFEKDRCLAGPQMLLRTNYRAHASFIFQYEHPDLHELRNSCIENLVPIVASFTSCKPCVITCDLYEPHVSIRKVHELPVFSSISNAESKYTVDTSTFTKKHLLMLLKFLDENAAPPQRLLYTRTANPIYNRLTEGISRVDTIPGFSGTVSAQKPTTQFLFLGFEPDRAIAIRRYFEPNTVIAVLSKISGTDSWFKRMVSIHHNLLSRNDVSSITVRASYPRDSFDVIEKEIRERGESYDFCIAPLGTKAQTIGIYEAARLYPQIQLVYCPPYRYLTNYPRRGKGETIMYTRDFSRGDDILHYTRT